MRAYISGATVLVVGILVGFLVAPGMRGGDSGPDRSTSVTHTTPATASGSSGAPGPSATTVSPTSPAGSTPVPGVTPSFDPAQPVTVGLGDSITFNADSWFRQICTKGLVLQNCLNAGIRGNTTAQMLARIDSDVLVHQPAIVIVMGGTNDLKEHESPQVILRRLDIMLDKARIVGAAPVLCTIPPRNGYGKQVLALNAAIRNYATKGHVPLLDLYPSIGTRTGAYKRGLTKDGIHPTRRAADLMTAAAKQQLPALLHPIRDSPLTGSLGDGPQS